MEMAYVILVLRPSASAPEALIHWVARWIYSLSSETLHRKLISHELHHIASKSRIRGSAGNTSSREDFVFPVLLHRNCFVRKSN